jgi:SAM-dependent methyltransferase
MRESTASGYKDAMPSVKNKFRRRDLALGVLAGLPPGRVLDAPCGEGLLAEALAGLGHAVWACDLDPAALVKRNGVRFEQVDLNRPLPYPDGFFDAVTSLEGIEHLVSPAVCLTEFARVLRPGGRLVLTTPNVNNVQSRLHYLLAGRFSGFRPITRRPVRGPGRPGHWHVTVPYFPTLGFLMAQAGLTIEAVEVTMIRPKQWLLLPLVLPMWLNGRRAPRGSMARLLGSWKLLLGRSLVVSAVKASASGS